MHSKDEPDNFVNRTVPCKNRAFRLALNISMYRALLEEHENFRNQLDYLKRHRTVPFFVFYDVREWIR